MALNLDTIPVSCSWRMYVGDMNKQALQFMRNGMPMDLTGYAFSAQARESAVAVQVALTALISVDSNLGIVTISWDGESMRGLIDASGQWQGTWDLQMVEPGETLPRTVLAGRVDIVADITRSTP